MKIHIVAAIPPSQNPDPGNCDECSKSMAGNLVVVVAFPDDEQPIRAACVDCYKMKIQAGDWLNEGTSLEAFIARI